MIGLSLTYSNLAYTASKWSLPIHEDHASPVSDIVVATPSSQNEPNSPLATAMQSLASVEKGRLFVQGRHDELLLSMNKKQRL